MRSIQLSPRARTVIAWAAALVLVGVALGSAARFIAWPFSSDKTGFSDEYALVLKDLDGKDVRLSTYKNDVLIAYVWASWCPYCGQEIENLAALKSSHGDRIQVVAINRAEPAAVAKSYIAGLTRVQGVVFLLDPDDTFFKKIGGYAMPETVFIRGRGEIVFHQRGPMQLEDVTKHLDELLAAH